MEKRLIQFGLLTVFLLLVAGISMSYAQSIDEYNFPYPIADEDYDERAFDVINVWEDDTPLLRSTKLEFVIQKIRSGSPNILQYVTFDTLQAVHDEIIVRSADMEEPTAYYLVAGENKSVDAFLGGLDNFDPHVVLKSIGYLGNWVDEIGSNLGQIKHAVDERLQVESTRADVRYALRVLKMKVVRRQTLEKIKGGNIEVLQTIDPEDFLPLVLYEPRIRTIYTGSPYSVDVNSIKLDRGVNPATGAMIGDRPGRAPGLDIERLCYTFEVPEGKVEGVRDHGEIAKYFYDQRSWRERGEEKPIDVDTAILPNSEVILVKSEDEIDWPCVRAIYMGLNNRSQFIREHSARIFLNYMARFSGDRSYLICNKMYSPKLAKFRDYDLDRRVAMVAWDNCKFSEFYLHDRAGVSLGSFAKYRYHFEADHENFQQFTTNRYFTSYVSSFPRWATEQTGNYRNDVKEILRILGLSFYIDPENSDEVLEDEAKGRINYRYLLADALFDPGEPEPTWQPMTDVLMGERDPFSQ